MYMNTNIFLIRHGDVENPEGIIYDGTISLSEFGKKKMRALGRTFREGGITPSAVVSSDFCGQCSHLQKLYTIILI
jgi:broad specificity phosphatase PhoE